jgi:hypothetical protein
MRNLLITKIFFGLAVLGSLEILSESKVLAVDCYTLNQEECTSDGNAHECTWVDGFPFCSGNSVSCQVAYSKEALCKSLPKRRGCQWMEPVAGCIPLNKK